MTIEVNVTEEDYLKFNEYHVFHSKSGKRTILLMRILFPVIVVVLEFLAVLQSQDYFYIVFESIFMVIAIAVWEIMMKKIMKSIVKSSIRNAKKDGKLPFHEEAQIEFMEDAIVERCGDNITTINKADIMKICEEENYYYVYFGAMQAIIIPKRCLGEKQAALEETLHTLKNVGKVDSIIMGGF